MKEDYTTYILKCFCLFTKRSSETKYQKLSYKLLRLNMLEISKEAEKLRRINSRKGRMVQFKTECKMKQA